MQEYKLLFTKNAVENGWGFYGFYWNDEDLDKAVEYIKSRPETWFNHKIVRSEIDLTD